LSFTASEGTKTEVKRQMMGSFLLNYKPFREILINDIIAEKKKKPIKFMTVFIISSN